METTMDLELKRAIEKKVSQLVKRVQDRKTAEVFEHDTVMSYDELQDILELSEGQVNKTEETMIVTSILSTMKSLPHTTQSKTRWAQFAQDRGMDGNIYSFSSKGDFTKYTQIVDKLTDPNVPKHIVMCTHTVRIDNLVNIAKEINKKNTELKKPRSIRIYLDEFDKYIDDMRERINTLVKLESVESIVIVTATPQKIWGVQKEWEKIMVLNPRILDECNSYLMFEECVHINTDDIEKITEEINYIEFNKDAPDDNNGSYENDKTKLVREDKQLIEHHAKILKKFPDILKTGKVLFAPGNRTRRSHECVSSYWTHYGCAVFIFNGQRTNEGFYGKLTLPDKSVIDIPHLIRNELICKSIRDHLIENKENMFLQAQLNEIIAEYYEKYSLNKYTLVITGLLTIERAQTLVHPAWGTFTDCIYYKAGNPDDKYQQQRQLGHVKNWKTYRGIPRVFAPEEFRKDVKILEKRADGFAFKHSGRMATLQDYTSISKEQTSSEIKNIKKEKRKLTRDSIIKLDTPFETIQEVNKFLSRELDQKIYIRNFHKTAGGFEVSTRLKSVTKKNKNDLIDDDRLTEEKFRRLNKTANITCKSDDSKKGGQSYMVYPVYPSMSSGPTEVKYYISYLPNPKK
jgi:hypothetical protein